MTAGDSWNKGENQSNMRLYLKALKQTHNNAFRW